MKYTLVSQPTKAGKKKLQPLPMLQYVNPLKRPLLFFNYIEKLTRLSSYRLYSGRINDVLCDTFFNFKNSTIYNIKVNTCKKFVRKMTK